MTSAPLTSAQKLALKGFLSLLASALVVTLSAVYQYYAAGNVSVSALLNFALLTFFITFGKALHDHIPPQAREAIQSAQETVQNAQESVRKAQETTQTVTSSIVPAIQQSQEAVQKVQETTQAMASNIVPAIQQSQKVVQKVQEITQGIASSIVPVLQQSQGAADTTQTSTATVAPVGQPGQGIVVPQGLSSPLIVIQLAPGSSLASSALTPDATGQVTTETLV